MTEREQSDGESGVGTADSVEDGASVDSFLRDVARAPGMSPPGSTLESETARAATLAGLVPGSIVARRFRLERKLGEGGMGVVWSATNTVTRKPVALKLLKPSGRDDERAVQRFLREARAVCAVRHPSVVEVHDVLELEDGWPVMVMELLSGETLAQRLTRERVIPLPELARVMVHVCSAVGCAHALGIVHRDLKPENIFLAGSVVKVLDFGIAKLTATDGDAARSGAITGTGAILGTPYYMAPEQLFGEKDIDHRADIWALGIILYEALTGERPTRGDNVGQIYKIIVTDAIVPLRERAEHLPAAVVQLIERMLSRDRAKRPPDVSAILSVLSAYTDESFVVVEGPPLPPPPGGSLPDRAEAEGDAAPMGRSGVELSPPQPPARGRWTARAFVPLGAAAVVLGAALATRTLRSGPSASAPVAVTPPLPAPASAPTASAPVRPEMPAPTAPPASAPVLDAAPAAASRSPAPSAAPARRSRPGHSAQPQPANVAPATPAVPSGHPSQAPPVDPGSYQ